MLLGECRAWMSCLYENLKPKALSISFMDTLSMPVPKGISLCVISVNT
jgi:hypothetical protein